MDILEHEEFLPMALRGPHSSLSCRNTHSLSLSFRTSSEAEITAPASSWEQIFKKYLSGILGGSSGGTLYGQVVALLPLQANLTTLG